MLRTLVVDDERLARKRLLKLLDPLAAAERVEVVSEARDGVEALEQLEEHDIDLFFLDIQMPELDGFDVLDKLPPDQRPAIIFVTAYDEYAIQAFEENALDYLLKPINRDRLEEAVARAEQRQQHAEAHQINEERLRRLLNWVDTQAEESAEEKEYLRQITIPHRDRILLVPVSKLVSAEIHEGITRLYVLKDDNPLPKPHLKQHTVDYTLDQLEANLDPEHFMRVHRSTIVQLDHIDEIISWFSGRYKLVLTTDHEVIASRGRSKKLKERLML